MIQSFIKVLFKEFFSETGDLKYFIGLEIRKHGNGIILTQQKYLQDLLQLTEIDGAKRVHIPMLVDFHLLPDQEEPLHYP